MSKNQSPSRTLSEWFRLVTECRQSGLSDSAWCLMNGIPRSTFSQAVRRLQKASYAVASKTTPTDPLDFTSKQEVVKIDIEIFKVHIKIGHTKMLVLTPASCYINNRT